MHRWYNDATNHNGTIGVNDTTNLNGINDATNIIAQFAIQYCSILSQMNRGLEALLGTISCNIV